MWLAPVTCRRCADALDGGSALLLARGQASLVRRTRRGSQDSGRIAANNVASHMDVVESSFRTFSGRTGRGRDLRGGVSAALSWGLSPSLSELRVPTRHSLGGRPSSGTLGTPDTDFSCLFTEKIKVKASADFIFSKRKDREKGSVPSRWGGLSSGQREGGVSGAFLTKKLEIRLPTPPGAPLVFLTVPSLSRDCGENGQNVPGGHTGGQHERGNKHF